MYRTIFLPLSVCSALFSSKNIIFISGKFIWNLPRRKWYLPSVTVCLKYIFTGEWGKNEYCHPNWKFLLISHFYWCFSFYKSRLGRHIWSFVYKAVRLNVRFSVNKILRSNVFFNWVFQLPVPRCSIAKIVTLGKAQDVKIVLLSFSHLHNFRAISW